MISYSDFWDNSGTAEWAAPGTPAAFIDESAAPYLSYRVDKKGNG